MREVPTWLMLIAQLSDTHIWPAGHLYQDVVDSNRMFVEALEHLHGLDRRPDLIVLTGDLVDEGLPDEYVGVRHLLDRTDIPYLVIPGNHDNREHFRAAFADQAYLPAEGPLHYCIDDHAVRIVALDSCVPDKHHGHVDHAGLEWLSRALERDTRKPTMLMLHHPPFVAVKARAGAMWAARLAGLVARQRPRAPHRSLLASQIAQASHAAPKLAGNMRPVTRTGGEQTWTARVVGNSYPPAIRWRWVVGCGS
jgi:hypothetical protein